MILKDNNEDISFDNITNMIYWKENNVRESHRNIWNKQDMDIRRLITSNFLIYNIYDEVNR